ncbi:hypothetical protein P175DRAFT_0530962 [Aspergillus ochraceoroseus IBT 24754]|uniref:Uncharacterized protein n=1 Tax=Aspergillus ochraceoroseus IBT 24754 TaxID=1392256 RepID=A0A2T5LYV4_9EURO|nr:uncharacterized protein P175DRAFT_0530962 [Aspergillus ochraceoroseus IBT 24754]PTU21464.1 hypothetical protein P175DRAFT_0530962 [Aspergillus ochraceoroseus IBT 24754]
MATAASVCPLLGWNPTGSLLPYVQDIGQRPVDCDEFAGSNSIVQSAPAESAGTREEEQGLGLIFYEFDLGAQGASRLYLSPMVE